MENLRGLVAPFSAKLTSPSQTIEMQTWPREDHYHKRIT